MGGAGRNTGYMPIDKRYLRSEITAVIRSRGVAAKGGFLKYCSSEESIGTEVSVRNRRSGRLSEVVAMRGSTVCVLQ